MADGRIELEGLPNTRDIGGIPSADGLFVKHAKLIRSGALSRVTTQGLAVLLDDYHLRTVIDLRTEEERKEHPDPEEKLVGVRCENIPVLGASAFGVTREGGLAGAIKMLRTAQKNPAKMMEGVYADMILSEDSQRGFTKFFNDVLATEEGAVLWHCTVGKDRAGLAAALLLYVLGAPREAILADYTATNRYVESETQNTVDALATYGLADKLSDSIHVINAADPRYLQAALSAVEREYGNLDRYVRDELDITVEKRAALRDRYLTDNPRG